MVKRGVLFAVRTGFLNIIYATFGIKGLTILSSDYKEKRPNYTPFMESLPHSQ
jgi:hypothetical protein